MPASSTAIQSDENASVADLRKVQDAQKTVVSPWRWVVAGVLLLAIVTGFFDRISVAVLFTDKSFNATLGTAFKPAVLGLLMSAFLLVYALSAIFLSFIGDLLGPRRSLGAAAVFWGVIMMLMGACSSYGVMLFYRIVLGLSEGPQFSFVSKTVQRWFPAHERSRATAIWMVGSPLGSAIGFPLTIWLVTNFGWRASFYVFGLINIFLIAPLIFGALRDRAPEGRDAPDAGTSMIQFADVRALLVDSKVWMISIYCMGLMTYIWGLNSWLPTYLERSRHINLHQMGIYSSLPFILMFFGELVSGVVSDRTGKRALISVLGLFFAGVLLFVATQVHQPQLAAIIIALSAASSGFGIPSEISLAMRILPPSATSTGIGIINGIGNLVGAFAPAVIGWIAGATGSLQSGLLVVVVMSMIGSLALIPMVRSH